MAIHETGAAASVGQAAAAATRVIDVSTSAQLSAAISNAQDGDVIRVAPGSYGDLSISGTYAGSGNITITSADPAQPAEFNRVTINNISGVTLDGVNVKFTPTATTVGWDSAIRVVASSDIHVVNCKVEGGPAVNGVPPDTPVSGWDSTGNVKGYYVGNGISVSDSTTIEIANTDISKFFAGIRTSNVSGIDILDNKIHDLRSTPIGGGNTGNVVISGNETYDFRPWKFGSDGDHGDFVHFFTRTGFPNWPSDNITITDNFFRQGAGDRLLGIYLDDDSLGLGHDNVLIANNVIVVADPQGIRFENVSNAVVQNNTLLQPASGNPNQAPGILLLDNTRNTVVKDNITSGVVNGYGSTEIPTGSALTNTILNNLVLQRFFANQPGYYGDLFVNPFSANPTLQDLLALPGSLIETLGVGSTLTRFPSAPGTLMGALIDHSGTGLSSGAKSFDAPLLFGAGGAVDLTGASVTWHFGDGTTASGLTAAHSYARAGSYTVTTQISLAGGQSVTIQKTVVVGTPFLVQTGFTSGATDMSDVSNPATVGSAVTFVQDNGNMVAKLNGGIISYDTTPDMFDNTEYTVMVDFRKLAASDAGGALLTFPGSFTVNVDKDGIVVSLSTSLGTSWIKKYGLGLDDTEWHTAGLVFDSATGTAALYLDGVEVAQLTGLDGAVQTGLLSHKLHIGNPWGGSFSGYVDNPLFMTGALKPDQMLAYHEVVRTGMLLDFLADDLTPNSAADAVLVLTTGNDSMTTGAGEDVVIGRAGDDDLSGSSGDDFLDGMQGNDSLYGGSENDRLIGGDGDDLLVGGAGSDRMLGETGNDRLSGGANRDRIQGGAGDDILSGGTEGDIFIVRVGDGNDQITDFTQGEDRIMLRFHAGVTGYADLSFSDVTGGVRVSIGSESVLLLGLTAANLQASDFVF